MNRVLYWIHRWLSLLALVQLFAWTGTGLFFALTPIEKVRGEDRTAPPSTAPVPWETFAPTPTHALTGASEAALRQVAGRWMWVAKGDKGRRWLADATSGASVPVDADLAGRVARADQRDSPALRDITRLDEEEQDELSGEYRGRPLPAWRVTLDDDRGTRIYVDALAGAVTARRNDTWRLYDFFWGLHIMDYRGRENFNNGLLVAFSMLGFATVLSGAVLWALRLSRRLRAPRRTSPPSLPPPGPAVP
jgi:uncharacterized iron-regulated membrane protein